MRGRSRLIDKRVGATLRFQRLKMQMSQAELAKAMGVSFQQIQKYESGTNSIAAAPMLDLCRVLKITPNDLIGIDRGAENNVVRLSPWTSKTALKLEEATPAIRRAIDAVLAASFGPH